MHPSGQLHPWAGVAFRLFLGVLLAASPLHSDAQRPAEQPALLLQYGHTEEIVGTPSISPDGKLAATIDGSREVIVWDLENGRQLRRLLPVVEIMVLDKLQRGESTVIYSKAAISPDGRLLAASGYGNATVWELESGRRRIVIRSADLMEPGDLAFSPDSRLLYMPGSSGDVIPYDVSTGAALRKPAQEAGFIGKHGFVRALALSADGRLLAFGGRKIVAGSNEIPGRELHWAKVIEAATGAEVAKVEHIERRLDRRAMEPKASNYPVAVAISPDGKMLALGGEGMVWLHETGSGREVRRLELKNDVAAGVAFSPDGRVLAVSGSRDYAVRLWDAASGLPLRELANQRMIVPGAIPTVGGFSKVAFTPDGRNIVGTTSRGSLRIWDVTSGSAIRFFGGKTDTVLRLAASRDGKRLATAGQLGNMIRIWNLDSGGQGESVNVHQGNINGIAFTPNSRHGISWSATGEVRLWDPETGAVLRNFDHRGANKDQPWDRDKCGNLIFVTSYQDNVLRAAISGDGRYLATSGLDCTLRVWDIESGKEIRRIDGVFQSVALSNEGRWLAARFRDNNHPLRIWDVASGSELPPIREAMADILLFDERNRLLYSGPERPGGGKPVIVWDIEQAREVGSNPVVGSYTPPAWSFDGRRLAVMNTVTSKVGEAPVHILDIVSGKRTDPAAPQPRGGRLRDVAIIPGGCCVAIAGNTGEVRILDHRTGELLVTMVSVRDEGDWLAQAAKTGKPWTGNDWLAVTPDGLFDGPPSSFDKLLWRFSERMTDIAPGEAFFNEFYRPGLLAEIMAGARPKAPRSIAEVDRRQPRVGLQVAASAGRIARVRIDVKEAPPGSGHSMGSGVRDVRLFRNGALVKRWAGEVAGGAGVLEAGVPIVAGENRFTAYAFNRDNVKSGDARAEVTGADSLRRPATAWVLAFGINRYANSGFDLNFSVADAQAFAEQIGASQTALGRYQKIHLASLKDAEATKANLLAALRRLSGKDSGPVPKGAPKALVELKPAQPEDAVFIFFAGHGLADGSRFYLVPHDLGYMGNREQFDEKAKATILRHAVSDQDLEAALETLDAERLVLAIDACHSGQALEAEERRRGPMNSKGLAQLAYEKGMYVITAAQSHQAALEFGQLGHGLLTYALVKEGLAQGQADRRPQDGRVEVREWLDYASARVPRLQLEAMRASAQRGRNVAVLSGEEKLADFLERTLQQPRVFYRREPERMPFVVGGTGR